MDGPSGPAGPAGPKGDIVRSTFNFLPYIRLRLQYTLTLVWGVLALAPF